MAVLKKGIPAGQFSGASGDTKPKQSTYLSNTQPHSVASGSTFYELDTGIMWITGDGETWVEKDTIVRLEASASIDIGDVTLLAGTASIGTLGANSGVDIGDVTLTAGTSSIGLVGHNKTGIGHGVETVDAVATAQPIAGSTPAKVVIVQAQTDNTGAIAVGGSGVLATVATGTGVLLYAGDSVTLEVDNLADVYIDATIQDEGVRFTYLS